MINVLICLGQVLVFWVSVEMCCYVFVNIFLEIEIECFVISVNDDIDIDVVFVGNIVVRIIECDIGFVIQCGDVDLGVCCDDQVCGFGFVLVCYIW